MALKLNTIFALIIVAALLQCRDSFDEKYDKAVLLSLRDDIIGMIGEPACDGVGHCRYIAFGSKPCGGPWEYLVYSVSITDSVQLTEKVEFYNQYEDMMNHKYGYISDCSVPEPPQLGCVDGVCMDMNVY
ncbi:MAG: hypothetical protein JSW64_07710 [Candidatus Zixiibacteriota bacterium]|nr:MAG: hypothetical protein JSW64_07710 [candidate division Zixibacteria bacterium]